MDLTVIATQTLRGWHAEAIAALHALSIGRREVSLSYSNAGGGRAASFAAADRDTLTGWIGQLADELSRRGEIAKPRSRRRAIGIRI